MYSGDVDTVKLRANRKITEQILDRFSEEIFITDVSDEQFSFKVDAVISDALITWIINYGKDLTVLKPEKLKDMVKERAQQVLDNYM
jgi:predicted DNA-binding transcriptional regulator YafY